MSWSTLLRDTFDRVPALRELRGYARIEAEEVLRNLVDDAIEEYRQDCETVGATGGAPEIDK